MVTLDLDKTNEEIVNDFDDLKELQKLSTRLFMLREATYQRRLALQVEIDKAKVEQDRIEAEKLQKEIMLAEEQRNNEAKRELKEAIINEVQKIMKEAQKE